MPGQLKMNVWFPTLVGEADCPEAPWINRGLAAHVRDRARRERGHAHLTTVDRGWQSPPGFLDTDLPEVQALRRFLDATLATYLEQWGRAYHNALAPRAFSYSYEGWAVFLEGGGFQHQHVHSRTDFVGVYFVEVPDLGPNPGEGCLTLVDPREGRLATRAVWENATESIRPHPGRLVLFPSFVPHRVDPFRGAGSRITINFDVTLQGATNRT